MSDIALYQFEDINLDTEKTCSSCGKLLANSGGTGFCGPCFQARKKQLWLESLVCECGRDKDSRSARCTTCRNNPPILYCQRQKCGKQLGKNRAFSGNSYCSDNCYMRSLSNRFGVNEDKNKQMLVDPVEEAETSLRSLNDGTVGANSLWSVIHELWQFLEDNTLQIERFPDACIYCGDWGTCWDHLIPRNFTGEIYRSAVPTVLSCQRCNAVLSDTYLMNIAERAALVAKSERRKNKKSLESKKWSDEEIESLGRGLQDSVKQHHSKRTHLLGRLTILDIGGILYLEQH